MPGAKVPIIRLCHNASSDFPCTTSGCVAPAESSLQTCLPYFKISLSERLSIPSRANVRWMYSTNSSSGFFEGLGVGSAAGTTVAEVDGAASTVAEGTSLTGAAHPANAKSADATKTIPPRFIMCRSLRHPTHRKPKDDPMDPDELFLHNHILTQYQQEVHQLRFLLARANAQDAQKDQHIAKLTRELEVARAPKPGPPSN